MAWAKWQVKYLEAHVGLESHQAIANVVGKHRTTVGKYIHDHNLDDKEYDQHDKTTYTSTDADRENIRMLVKYIVYGLRRGVRTLDAIDRAIVAVRGGVVK